MRRLFFLVLFVSIPVSAATVGMLSPSGSSFSSRGIPFMVINATHPAKEAGTLNTATVRWYSSGLCTNAFKLKFLRPAIGGPMTVVAERGPFNAINGFVTVTLTPAVTVAAGDLIAVTHLQPSSCGGVLFVGAGSDSVWIFADADPAPGATLPAVTITRGGIPIVRASTDANVLDGYIPVVGSTAGGFGSQFKTALQLTNPDSAPLNGRLVFHPAGASADPSDPSISYSLTAFQTLSFDNVMDNFGRTGLGSVDVITTSTGAPLISTRVFNDAGASGTSGFSEDYRAASSAVANSDSVFFTIPSDLTNFRVNVGIRSLDAGATLSITMVNGAGSFAGGPFTRTYLPNMFEQISLSQFVNNTTLHANGVVQVMVTSGSAIIYGTTNDNRTNDPAFKYFTH